MPFDSVKRIVVILLVLLLYGIAAFTDAGKGGIGSGPAKTPSQETAQSEAVFVENIVNPSSRVAVSHVSSVAWLGDGKIACVWYGGTREGARDVKIYYAVYREATGEWSREKVLVSRDSSARELGRYVKKVGNPVIFRDEQDRLWLFYVSIALGGWSGSSLNYKVSLDQGETWTPSRKLILSPFLNLSTLVKNKPVLLEGGGFMLPIYHELLYKFPEILWGVPDGTRLQYRRTRASRKAGLLQPAFFPAGEGRLVGYFRNASRGDRKYVLESTSSDGGVIWSRPAPTVFPNPNSGLDLAVGPEGRVVIVLNDTFEDRWRLAVYASTDYGRRWKKIKDLEGEPGKEFSYPSIIRTPGGMYHVTYTYDRRYIKHVAFSEAWLRQNES